MEENDWQKKVDELIVRGARITENGRLDFPSRLPICPDPYCSAVCIYRKLWIYLERNERLFEEGNLAIGSCSYPVEPKDLDFPILYSRLDYYSESYYVEKILPVIFRFYEEGFLEELLFNVVRTK
jgi:hypothetical protein